MSFDFIVVGIDPGIDIAGYSIIKHEVLESHTKCSLLKVSSVKADLGTTAARVRFLCAEFALLISKIKDENPGYKIAIAIECPNEAMYGGNAGRTSGVIKLIAAAYGIFGGLTAMCPVFIVRPTDWQPSKKSREVKDVKVWSLAQANAKLEMFRPGAQPFKKPDQDAADSLNVCICGLSKLINKEWIV